MPHLVLLGDSIFDNAAYVPGGDPVIAQVNKLLPSDWKATLLAVDGDVTQNVAHRLASLPGDATHFVISVGGNDALRHIDILRDSVPSALAVFQKLTRIQEEFQSNYGAMLDVVLGLGKPTVVCTVYDAVPGLVREAKTALSVFNDVILREAIKSRVPVLDLRSICDHALDYSSVSPIEPSEQGGNKIAAAIVLLMLKHDFSRNQCLIST
jgi:GDSL-like Lipase/Acylhydrolase family